MEKKSNTNRTTTGFTNNNRHSKVLIEQYLLRVLKQIKVCKNFSVPKLKYIEYEPYIKNAIVTIQYDNGKVTSRKMTKVINEIIYPYCEEGIEVAKFVGFFDFEPIKVSVKN